MDVGSFDEIAAEFDARVRKIVWCTMTTVDRQGRPRSRMMHPIWEGSTGWVATRAGTLKAKHLAGNGHVSLSYWDPDHRQVYADCRARFIDDAGERKRIWDLYGRTEPPLGYDLATIWNSPDDPEYALLHFEPWRIEISSIHDMAAGQPPKVWRPDAR